MSDSGSILQCSACNTQIAPALLCCPACKRLVHSAELTRLASEARAARGQGDLHTSLVAWRRTLELLPDGSRQRAAVSATIDELSRQVDAGPHTDGKAAAGSPPQKRGKWAAAAVGAGTIGLLLWKLKFVLAFVLTKGKLLLLGLTKAGTFWSMALSLGVYWTIWGWKFALGLVLSIYVHEMGHVAALHRFGIKATVPMFIPGLGAVIRLKQYPASPREDARVGLAGPLWGLGAALAAYLLYLATGWSSLAAIAKIGAWINLFNLLPVWQLDGARGFRALTRRQRWAAVAVIGLMWYLSGEGMLMLLLIVAALRTISGKAAERPDRTALIEYIFLVVVLSAMTTIYLPGIDV